MSEVCWSGNVGQDPQFSQLESGVGRAAFSLAMTPRVKRGSEWVDGPTVWVRVTAWRALAGHVRDCVRKGDPVIVYGRVDPHRWTDDRGGVHDELRMEAQFIGHDLRRGVVAGFTRTGRPPADTQPRYETDTEAELRALEAAEEIAWAREQEQASWATADEEVAA